MNKYDAEAVSTKRAVEKAKKSPTGMDFPVLGSESKFPINLYCNDSLEPSTLRQTIGRYILDGCVMVLVL